MNLSMAGRGPLPPMGRRLQLFMASSDPRSSPEVGKAVSPPRSPEHAFGYLNPHYSDCMLRIFRLGGSSMGTEKATPRGHSLKDVESRGMHYSLLLGSACTTHRRGQQFSGASAPLPAPCCARFLFLKRGFSHF